MEDFALGYHPGCDPLHDLWDEALGHLVHGRQCGQGVLRHTVATRAEPLDQQTCLHDQLPHLGEQARQHLALGLFALGKQMVFFDRPEDRLHLCECRIDPHHRAGFEFRQGAATALRPPPQDPRFVGIPYGQLLGRSIGREETDIGKAVVVGHMEDQRIDLLDPVLAQGRVGSGDIGMIPNLRAGVVLAAKEHPCHHILRHVRFHLACVEMLHQHQHHQGDIQGYIPGQARAAIGVFAGLPPMTLHDRGERVPR
jgi:hypothetical protein